MNADNLRSVAKAIVAARKGVLAADESNPTIAKRFFTIGLESTEENRRRYREILFTTEGIETHLGGVILFEDTLRQTTRDGTPFPKLLADRGILPGIKVDRGTSPLPFRPGEKITEGLDGLRERLEGFHDAGAKFAKWRAVLGIGLAGTPSRLAIRTNAQALARYAALCQEVGLVPIVEPEVLMDGAHDIERCESVTSMVLAEVFRELDEHGVLLEGMLLKPNMVGPGASCPDQATVAQVAEATLRCLRRHVPAAVPGIVFLSGGQSAEAATVHLDAMNRRGPHPWQVSFSYGRALQAPVLDAWKGQERNVPLAQEVFQRRCLMNGLAREGEYVLETDREE